MSWGAPSTPTRVPTAEMLAVAAGRTCGQRRNCSPIPAGAIRPDSSPFAACVRLFFSLVFVFPFGSDRPQQLQQESPETLRVYQSQTHFNLNPGFKHRFRDAFLEAALNKPVPSLLFSPPGPKKNKKRKNRSISSAVAPNRGWICSGSGSHAGKENSQPSQSLWNSLPPPSNWG